jgi:hypothetical protein
MKTMALQVRVHPKEKEAFEQAAQLAGISFSAWARVTLRRAAIREFEDAGRRLDLFNNPLDQAVKDGGRD